MVVFLDESQDNRYFVLGAAVTSNAHLGHVVVTQTRKVLGSPGRLIPEFHESALNQVNPGAIDAFLNNMVYEYLRKRSRRVLRKDISIYLVYYRKTRAERASRSLPFARLLTVYTALFEALLEEINPAAGTTIYCDSFQGIARIMPELQKMGTQYGASVSPTMSSLPGVQLADMATGTGRRFLNQEVVDRYAALEPIVRLLKEVVLSAK